ncbi:MAG: amidohydrolase [SAR324 cluster bacterium]|nr:amidohydrolase [SAR324 cluster bacterium]
MQNLNVTLIQTILHWQDPAANRQMFEDTLVKLDTSSDLIVLPEMFSTGFTMDSSTQAEAMSGTTMAWMQQMAEKTQSSIMGSLSMEEAGNYYNRLICMYPNGKYVYYDKRHLFRMANEHQYYSPGKQLITLEINGWVICPLICYDLRFPVWSRNKQGYDLLIYVANWPERRRLAWNALLKARAIENISYVVGVNRIGKDDNGIEYSGDSTALDFLGQEIIHQAYKPLTSTICLDYEKLRQFRKQFPAHQDADDFEIML